MGQPTQIITESDITQVASDAANKMSSALETLEQQFAIGSDIFEVPPTSDALANLESHGFSFGGFFDFRVLDNQLAALSMQYAAAVTAGSAPIAPDVDSVSLPVTPTIPSLLATLPEISIPTAPAVTIPSVPVAPNIADVDIPDTPIVAIPAVPELSDVTLPSISSISIPLFTEVFPEVPDDLTVAEAAFLYEEDEYTSDELVALRDLLLDDLRNGGWGVNHTDEEALFAREVDRAASAGVTNEETAIESMASRGFELPSGILAAVLRKAQQSTLDEIADANREVSIQRADLIRKSRESVINSTVQLNQTMVTHFGFVQQRLITAAQFVSDFSLRVFNANAESYNTRVRAFEAYTNAWAVRIRGQMAQLEAEKVQIEAESLKIAVDKSRIDAYAAQVRAVGLSIDIFNTEMQAAKTRSDIEHNRLLVFNSQVDAHRAVIQSEIAKVQAYTAEVNAQGTRVDLYKTQVDAHASEVRAAEMASRIQVNSASIELDSQRTQLAAYSAAIDGYRAEAGVAEANSRISIANINSSSSISAARADLLVSKTRIQDEEIKYIRGTEEILTELRLRDHQMQNELAIDTIKLKVDQLVTPADQWQKFYESVGALASAVDVEIT